MRSQARAWPGPSAWLAATGVVLAACAGVPRTGMLPVPAGDVILGSTDAERAQAYLDAERTAGDARARKGNWFEREVPRHVARRPAFWLDRTHVTQAEWAAYLASVGGKGPCVDENTWWRQGYVQDFGRQVRRMCWQGATPPEGRASHPVVLVTHDEAARYCAWRGARLPTADELEHAMRGTDGRTYPWGNAYDPARLAGADDGPGDTEPVGSHPAGAGPYGHLDLAGNAFAWTSTSWELTPGAFTVKGSAWDDHGGVGRGAARHGRPAWVRHVIIGVRCAAD